MKNIRIRSWIKLSLAGVFMIAAFSVCARVYVLKSRLPAAEITIDGKIEDWKGALYVLGDENALVGFMNDRDSLYVCLVAGDRRSSFELMRAGLTVWIDPAGGKKKILGIKFPVRTAPAGRPDEETGGETGRSRRPAPVIAEDEVEILRSNSSVGEVMALEALGKMGFELKTDTSGGSFIYELKIPLIQSDKQPVAVGSVPGAAIGVGIETGELEMRPQGEGGGGGRGGGIGGGMGGRGGMGGGRGGMGGGRGGYGGTPNIPKPIKFWAAVQLAAGDKTGKAAVLSLINQ